MQGIGIGVSDFKMLRVRNNYFIDKSLFIKDIIDNQSSVTLITRPRRFGKTLNMSMLRYYFDCTQKDNRELFTGLKIMEQDEKYTSKLGYYPCIYMTLKDVRGSNFEEMMLLFGKELSRVFKEHSYLLESEKLFDIEKEIFNSILNSIDNLVQLQRSIKLLTKFLNKYYDKPAIVLLDEDDTPMKNAYIQGFYDDAVNFFKSFYSITFKDNQFLDKAVITGVSRVAKESIFSGANNFDVYTILDDEFSEDFGITKEEMKKVIRDFNIEDDEEEIKQWYDGYIIGNKDGIYNPWSILNYLKNRELMPYWVNTSSNDLIKLILKKSNTVKQQIERLLKDEAIEVSIDLETVITGIENNENNIWGLLVGTGYLKYETSLRERGFNNITKMVFAFKGKEVKMEVY